MNVEFQLWFTNSIMNKNVEIIVKNNFPWNAFQFLSDHFSDFLQAAHVHVRSIMTSIQEFTLLIILDPKCATNEHFCLPPDTHWAFAPRYEI